MTREEHIAWCKKRALEYWTHGDLPMAVTSMMSDMSKHEDTKNHAGLEIGKMMFGSPMMYDRTFVLRFIEGFR